MAREKKTVHNFATTQNRKKRCPADHLDYDTRRAMQLGYGVRYGQYKADHPNTRADYEHLVEQSKPPRKKTTQKERICPLCGKTFLPKPATCQTYCGPECKEIARQRTVKAARERRKVKPNTVATCPICKKEFVSTRGRKYCGKECSAEAGRINSARLRALYRQEEKHDTNH